MKKILFILVAGLLIGTISKAQIPERPNPPRLVNDFAKIFSESENSMLEDTLAYFARKTSTQIVVVTVPDLQGYDPSDFAYRIGQNWGVGQKGKDNGLVILLKPKVGNSRGEVFISTGYGLEAVLPDAILNSTVIENEMIPAFKDNNYYLGLSKGIKVIMEISRGEYTAEQYQEFYTKQSDGIVPAIVIFILFFIVFPLLRGRRRRFYSPGKSLPFWLALGMMSGGRHSGGGSFGNFSSGGGGFGGFGGGSFGGGGAGGSW